MIQPIQDPLERYLNTRVQNLIHISNGWENEVYAFSIGSKDYILRLYPGEIAVEKSTREFNGMEALRRAGYPVPAVQRHETDLTWFGKPFVIMEKIAGQSLRHVLRAASAERRGALFQRYCRLFVDLHTLDYRPFLSIGAPQYDPDDPTLFLRMKLAEAQQILIDRFRLRDFLPALDWLAAHQGSVPARGWSALHLDYHDDNLLLTPDDRLYVIDWTNIEVGDYRYDLAWTVLLHSTYGHPQMRDVILREYERQRGAAVEQIAYFEVMAAVRRLFTIVVSLGAGGEQLGMRPEAAALIQQHAGHITAVYDVFKDRCELRIPAVERLIESL